MSYSVKKYVGSNQGFTLVELLIVVAIIGVLASQGVPAYRRMIQKSRKGEAQVMLGNIATAESGFFSEYGEYTDNIARAGAQTEGQTFNYAAGFPSDATCGAIGGANVKPAQGTDTANGQVPNLPGNWNTGIAGPADSSVKLTSMVGNVKGYILSTATQRGTCATDPVTTVTPNFSAVKVSVGATKSFVASATGNIKDPNTATCQVTGITDKPCDVWYIDQNRRMLNVIDGVAN